MASALSRIPADSRRRMAATFGLLAALFVAVGAVAMSGDAPATVRVFGGVAFAVALGLGLVAWGTAHSVRVEADAARMDAAISDVLAGHDLSCGCGHEHDPSEMHVTCDHSGGPPANEGIACGGGAGVACEHDCETCVLANLRR